MDTKIYVVDERKIMPLALYPASTALLHGVFSGESYERGLLPFDVMEARGTVCFMHDVHLERFFLNLKACRIALPFGKDLLTLRIGEALADAGIIESKVRIDVVLGGEKSPAALAVLIKIQPLFKPSPIKLAIAEYSRSLPMLKLAGGYTFAQFKKREHPWADDILYVDPLTKMVTEASRANFFAVRYSGATSVVYGFKNLSQILPGITRLALLNALRDPSNHDLASLIEAAGEMRRNELELIDEVFISSSGVRIAPVERIDDRKFEVGSDKRGGRVTRALSRAFNEQLERYYQLKSV